MNWATSPARPTVSPTPAASGTGKRRDRFGIYVHWPFCAAKCPYCDFNSHVRTEVDEAGWAGAILSELEWTAEFQGSGRPAVDTVFFGGGTPSLVGGKSVASVIDEIARHWTLAADAEITLESNPASAEADRFRDYRAAGVNRLSLGVQALTDDDLKFLGRLHNVAEAMAALKIATSTFDRVSLDLIYARPGQTTMQWRNELREALTFGTEHLSLYQLTIEEGTPFANLARSGALVVPGDYLGAALYEITQELTEQAGRPAYEISNHARPGAECRHNLIYWRYGAYAGVGPGAQGRLDIDGKRFATSCEKLPERWRQKVEHDRHGLVERAELSAREAAREHLLMSLRLAEGIDLKSYRLRWGVELDDRRILPLVEEGLLYCEENMLSATPRGRLVLNAIIAAIAD